LCQFQAPGLYSRHPLNSRLYGLCILLVCLVQEKNFFPFPGVKPRSVGFTTCSHVTIPIVLCRLPILALSWFIEWKRRYMELHAVQYYPVCWASNCFRRKNYCSYKAQLSQVKIYMFIKLQWTQKHQIL
jgi:hypothetical protein